MYDRERHDGVTQGSDKAPFSDISRTFSWKNRLGWRYFHRRSDLCFVVYLYYLEDKINPPFDHIMNPFFYTKPVYKI